MPRRGPVNLPFLGMNVSGETWVLANTDTKPYETTDGPCPTDPVFRDLRLDGVKLPSEIDYWGHYPIADLEYETDAPGSVGLRAWAPFLPGDIGKSLLPGIAFGTPLTPLIPAPSRSTSPDLTEAEAGASEFTR